MSIRVTDPTLDTMLDEMRTAWDAAQTPPELRQRLQSWHEENADHAARHEWAEGE